jgi:signal peptidase I
MMARRSGFRRIFLAAIGCVLVAAGWFLFAPPILGGSTGYAIVTGSSMVPRIQPNDLVVLRAQPTYRVGDVVAYRSETLGTVVLHRIVGASDDRVVMKGDDNSWTDADRPSTGDLIGEEWFRIPALGGALRQPWTVFAFVTALLLAAAGLAVGGRRHRRSLAGSNRSPHPRPAANPAVGTVVAVLGVAMISLATLGFVAFTSAVTRQGTSKVTYRSSGSFGYEATVPPGSVYPRGRVTTGDPVFLQLVDTVGVSFSFRFGSASTHEVGGTARLFATVSDANGWSRTIALGPATSFTGDEGIVRGRLDLAAIGAQLDRVQARTGIVGGHHELHLIPRVELFGTVAGTSLRHTFSPHLRFQLDPLLLRPSVLPDDSEGAPSDAINPVVDGFVRASVPTAATFSAFGRSVEVVAVRWLALLGTLACLVGLVVLLVRSRRRKSWDEARRIESRYGPLLARVHGDTLGTSDPIEVVDIETLVRLAEHYDHLILHGDSGGAQDYVVEHDGLRYRYRIVPVHPAFDAKAHAHRQERSGNGPRSIVAGVPR